MKVRWTASSRENLRDIRHYIARQSPAYARRTIGRIMDRVKQISEFPLSGRVVPEFELPQVREMNEGPYRIIYHIHSNGTCTK